MNRFEELNNRVVVWAKEKGILDKATPLKQAEKTLEEVQELIFALTLFEKYGYIELRDRDCNDADFVVKDEVKDALGDILVTILIQAKMQGIDLLDCLERAVNIIEKRTGKMIDGKFVKDNSYGVTHGSSPSITLTINNTPPEGAIGYYVVSSGQLTHQKTTYNNMQELKNGYYWARYKGEIGEEFIIEVFKDEWWKTGVEHNCKDNDIEILERVEYAR